MIKAILAVSQGGPDAESAFRLAAVAGRVFEAGVDALHIPSGIASVTGAYAMAGEVMATPAMVEEDEQRLQERAKASATAFKTHLSVLAGAHYAEAKTADLGTLVAKGRTSDLIVLGRPGSDPENPSPGTVEAALFESARPVMIAPPELGSGTMSSAVVAWNGSAQAARAVNYALPFLVRARSVTILVVGNSAEDVNAPDLARYLARHGIAAATDAINPGAVSARARGRALLEYTHGKATQLLVMGGYGRGQVLRFLGLGGATGKVITACRVPVLIAH